jgi:hypothetical protein
LPSIARIFGVCTGSGPSSKVSAIASEPVVRSDRPGPRPFPVRSAGSVGAALGTSAAGAEVDAAGVGAVSLVFSSAPRPEMTGSVFGGAFGGVAPAARSAAALTASTPLCRCSSGTAKNSIPIATREASRICWRVLPSSSQDSIGRVPGARWLPVTGGRLVAACRPGRATGRWCRAAR